MYQLDFNNYISAVLDELNVKHIISRVPDDPRLSCYQFLMDISGHKIIFTTFAHECSGRIYSFDGIEEKIDYSEIEKFDFDFDFDVFVVHKEKILATCKEKVIATIKEYIVPKEHLAGGPNGLNGPNGSNGPSSTSL